ncbi:MAG: hypothetical protein NT091_03035 [Candidatus Falkowbacteria bacterium]|nr:hypothetical protein [Candidatus Falkowbacteria bacterium]
MAVFILFGVTNTWAVVRTLISREDGYFLVEQSEVSVFRSVKLPVLPYWVNLSDQGIQAFAFG